MNGANPGSDTRGQARHQECAGQHGGHFLNSAIGGYRAGTAARDQESGDQEHRGGGDAVVEHVQRRTTLTLGRHHEDAENDEAEVRDRCVGDQSHDVGLSDRDDGAVDDTDHRERDDRRPEIR